MILSEIQISDKSDYKRVPDVIKRVSEDMFHAIVSSVNIADAIEFDVIDTLGEFRQALITGTDDKFVDVSINGGGTFSVRTLMISSTDIDKLVITGDFSLVIIK